MPPVVINKRLAGQPEILRRQRLRVPARPEQHRVGDLLRPRGIDRIGRHVRAVAPQRHVSKKTTRPKPAPNPNRPNHVCPVRIPGPPANVPAAGQTARPVAPIRPMIPITPIPPRPRHGRIHRPEKPRRQRDRKESPRNPERQAKRRRTGQPRQHPPHRSISRPPCQRHPQRQAQRLAAKQKDRGPRKIHRFIPHPTLPRSSQSTASIMSRQPTLSYYIALHILTHATLLRTHFSQRRLKMQGLDI